MVGVVLILLGNRGGISPDLRGSDAQITSSCPIDADLLRGQLRGAFRADNSYA